MSQTTSPTPTPQPPPPSDTVTLTINGRSVTARKGTLVVEAAKQVGIEIPVFCYHPKLKSVGACRMCLVQIEKLPGVQTACTTPVAQDMVVTTNSPDAVSAQNGVIEFLLANHPLDCPICDKGGECPLQDNTFKYGRGVSRFTEEKRHMEKAYPLSDRIVLDRERCIMCYRCVRFHQEITGDEALAAVQRGPDSMIGTLPGESYDSIFSGNTVELCPVGALTSRQYRFKARPWDLVRTPSVCNGCAVGCNLEVHSRTESVLRLVARENPDVDGGWLCDAGRFRTVPAPYGERPERPLVRDSSGALHSTTWNDALHRAAELLSSNAGVLASASLSNEALWLLQHRLRQSATLDAALWPAQTSAWPVEGNIANLLACKTVVLVGLDAWHDLPVLALWIRKAVLAGAKLTVIGSRNGLYRDTVHWLKCAPGAEAQVAQALRAALDGGTLADTGGVPAVDITAAAADLKAATAPVAFLVHPAVLAGAGAGELQAFAARLGATGEAGLVGAPLLSANGRGAQDLTPDLAAASATDLLARTASGQVRAILLLGEEAWSAVDTGAARRVLATWGPIDPADDRVDVVLPLAHPYERQGSITNLEGRVQFQEGGASPPLHARSDWGVVSELAKALGASVPTRLSEVRHLIAEWHPSWSAMVAEEALVVRV